MSKQQLAAQTVTFDDDIAAADRIELRHIDVPAPAQGQVLVRIKLRAMHQFDLMVAGGRFPGWAERLPFTSGCDAVGVVEENGPGATKFSPDQRVAAAGWGPGAQGAWQQYAVVDEGALVAVPDSLADEAAAQFFINPPTALGLVEDAAVPQGGWLLQGAANSSLGRMVVQQAAHIGVRTINIVRRPEQVEALKALGADVVIVSPSSEDLVARIKEATGGELAFAALDPVGGTATSSMLAGVREGGTVLLYGGLAGDTITIKLQDIFPTGRCVRGWLLAPWLTAGGAEATGQRLTAIMQLLADGIVTPPMKGPTFDLKDVHAAIAALQSGRHDKVFISS